LFGTSRIGSRASTLIALILCAWLPVLAQQQTDRVSIARSRFEHETDPVHKAKLMVPLGTAEFDQIEKQVIDSDISNALSGLQTYQGQVMIVEKGLDAKNVDPEKHPAGFKELEISVRESLRRLDNVLVRLSGDDQKPFLDVRKSLDDVNRHLIKQLFPLQPGVKETPKPSK
jgi:hypothetical protein